MLLPAASLAMTIRVWLPLLRVVVFHVQVYGVEVSRHSLLVAGFTMLPEPSTGASW